eukprot:s999_g14.t1
MFLLPVRMCMNVMPIPEEDEARPPWDKDPLRSTLRHAAACSGQKMPRIVLTFGALRQLALPSLGNALLKIAGLSRACSAAASGRWFGRGVRPMAPKDDKITPVDKLRAFYRSNQANKRCADCPERGPTYVCLDFQIFVCQACAGLHREFGHKIKSISFSEWSFAEVAKLEEAGGNEAARAKWLDRWHKDTFPEPDGTDLEAIREFIRLKYVEKKWYRPHAKPAAVTQAAPQAAPESTAQAAGLDLLSGADTVAPAAPAAAPAAAPVAAPAAPVQDLLGSLEASPVAAPPAAPAPVEEPWTADFGSAAKVPVTGYDAGLIDLDFTGGSPPKAAAPKPTEVSDGTFPNLWMSFPLVAFAAMHPDASDGDLQEAPYRALAADAGRKQFAGTVGLDGQSPSGAALQSVCRAILVVELAERTCYYALAGSQEFFLERLGYGAEESAGVNSAFTTLCYMWPLVGGYVADAYLGRYYTILVFTLCYLIGVLTCAIAALPGPTRDAYTYLVGSMVFLALGTGGIKPNISNFGADQFDSRSVEGRRAREEFYTNLGMYFYMSINMGVLVSYGFLTTLCSSGLPGLISPSFGYATAYFLAAMAMVVALTVFLCFSSSYRCLDRHVGNAIRGVVLHVVSAAVEGSWRATAICIGWPLLLLGLLLSVCISLIPASAGLGLFGALSVLGGLLLATYGCGELSWVQSAAQRNSHVTRQQTADFLRIMPTLAAVNLAFNSVYNCMAFWFQDTWITWEQACLMDVRLGPLQLNGSFFNVADGLAIVVFTHPLMNYLNPWLERRFGLRRHGKVLLGCALAAVSVLWAIHLEEQRQRAPLLDEESLCAPDGMKMSRALALDDTGRQRRRLGFELWGISGKMFSVDALKQIHVGDGNPTLYYLAYSQSPLRLRSSAQALGLLMSATSSALFTILTAILGGKDSDSLQVGYFLSLTMMIPFICWYLCVQSSWEERHFDEESEAEVQPGQLNKGVAFSRTGMLRDFASPQSIGGSPAMLKLRCGRLAAACFVMEVPLDDVVYQIVDSPEDFVLQGLQACGGIMSDHEDVRSGKVLAVAKHPTDYRMDYWLKVEYGDSKTAFVHMLMSCGSLAAALVHPSFGGWTSNKLMLDVSGDVAFPPGPKSTTAGSSVPLPDLDPGNYDQEFVVPSHLEAIETNAKLKSVFPEASRGQVRSVWRHDDRFWLEVTSEGTCYGAHFIEPEEGSEVYYLTCAVKLPEDEEFPPAPLTTRGEAVAFEIG